MTALRQLRILLIGVLSVAWLCIAGEALCRFEGNWRFDRLTLTKGPATPPDPARALYAERALLQQITYQKGVDPEWFFLAPAPLKMPQNRELQARTAANPGESHQETFIWNDAWLAHPSAEFVALIRQQKTDTLFTFPTYDGSPIPRYRLYPNNDFSPTPWVTNRWGWLGADTGVRKPPHTIRVGIIGDSTSHNMYALNLQSYFQAWANRYGYSARFEVFSTGRQGLGDDDELAVLKYELAPMGLDYVYRYFAPEFSLARGDVLSVANTPANADVNEPPGANLGRDGTDELVAQLLSMSALTRDVSDFATSSGARNLLHEPAKPQVTWHLAAGVQGHVVLSEARQHRYFGWLINKLETFRATAESLKATPFVSTERLCVWHDMTLRKGQNQHLYDVLNGPLFWPFTYGALRRMADAHNRVIETWAAANAVTVVDIDGRMPARPDMCEDPWHDVYIGHRMRAWLIFQAMLPQLEHDLRTGAVPRANRIDSDVHPYLSKPIERIDREKWLAKVESSAASAMPAK